MLKIFFNGLIKTVTTNATVPFFKKKKNQMQGLPQFEIRAPGTSASFHKQIIKGFRSNGAHSYRILVATGPSLSSVTQSNPHTPLFSSTQIDCRIPAFFQFNPAPKVQTCTF